MSAVGPSTPSNSYTGVTNTIPASLNIVVDTITRSVGSGYIPLLAGPSILSYSKHLITTSDAHKKQLFEEEQSNAVNLNPLFAAAIAEAQHLIELRAEIIKRAHDAKIIANTQNDYIDGIVAKATLYNSNEFGTDNANITTINQAVVTYNAAVDTHLAANLTYLFATAAFNTATTTYNNATATYNAALATYNTALATYNAAVAAFNAGQITQAQMNAAQATYNNALSTFNAAQATYDAAVATYIAANQTYNAATNAKVAADTAYASARTAYSNARTTYQNYATNVSNVRDPASRIANVNAAIAAYNAQIAATNAAIDDYNTAAAGLGLPLLNHETPYTASVLVPLPNSPTLPANDVKITAAPIAAVPVLPGATATNFRITDADEAANVANALNTSTGDKFALSTLLYKILRNIKLQQDFLGFFLGARPIPKAYIETHTKVFTTSGNSTTVGSGSGVSASMLSKGSEGLNDKTGKAWKAVGDSIFDSFVLQYDPTISPAAQQVRHFRDNLLKNVSLFSAFTAIGALQGKTADVESPAVKVTQAVAFASQVAQTVNGDSIENSITEILQGTNPELSPDEIAGLANALGADTKLNFLQVALSQLGEALGQPNLFGRVIASNDLASRLISFPITQQIDLGDVLKNPLSIAFLKDLLATTLFNQDTTLNTLSYIQQLISRAVDGALTQAIKDINELKAALLSSLETSLQAAGLSPTEAKDRARELTQLADTFLDGEVRSNFILDTGIRSKDIDSDRLIQALLDQRKTEAQITAAKAHHEIILDAAIADKVVRNLKFNQDEISIRELRDQIAQGLRDQGLDDNVAIDNATTAVVSVFKDTIPARPDIVARPDVADVRRDLISNITDILKPVIGAQDAQVAATNAASLIVGPPVSTAPTRAATDVDVATASVEKDTTVRDERGRSQATGETVKRVSLTDLYDQNIQKLTDFGRKQGIQKEVGDLLAETQRGYLRPNLEIFVRNEELRDPAKNLIQYSGIFNKGIAPLPRDWDQNFFA